jgi:Transposase and inactivated derivatives
MSKDSLGYQCGSSRSQLHLLPPSIEEYVADNSPVRFIEVFVESLDMSAMQFTHHTPATTGRPPYDPKMLLSLYIYGYLFRIESSRRLEAEAKRNLEVMWLLHQLQPDFKTIARFRSENATQFELVLKAFNKACAEMTLFSREVVAVDGSKFKAVNSKDRYLKRQDIEAARKKADAKITDYLEAVRLADEADEADEAAQIPAPSKEELQSKLDYWKKNRQKLVLQEEVLNENKVDELGLTDPDCVRLTDRKHCAGVVGYNVQCAVEGESHLVVAVDAVTDKNDLHQLAAMALKAQEELRVERDESQGPPPVLKVLADAGYHEASELEQCEKAGIVAVVPAPRSTSGRNNAGVEVFDLKMFAYDKDRDLFVCPAGMELPRKSTQERHGALVGAYYNRGGCKTCALKPQCTTGQYRRLKRREDQEMIDRAAQCYQEHRPLFKRRKAIVEHVFGTWRNKGQGRFLQRGLTKIRGELQLMALAYNIGRVIQLKGVTALIEKMREMKEQLNVTKVTLCLLFGKRGSVIIEF